MTQSLVLVVLLLSGLAVLAIFRGIYILLMSDIALQADFRLLPKQAFMAAQPKRKHQKRAEALLERLSITRALDEQLEKANVRLSVLEWVMIWGGIVLGSALVGFTVSHSWLGTLAMAGAGFVAPRIWINRRIEKRRQLFNEQLIDSLRMITSSLQAGHGMLQALQLVAQEMPSPTSEEFDRVVREVALGYSMSEALIRLAQRMQSDDLDMIVTAINIQAEVGGSLSEILRNISETVEGRIRLRGEVRAMTAQQRMSGYVISGMPFLLGLIISVLNPDYLMQLFKPQWRWLPGTALVMMVLGQIAMRKVLDIDV